MRLIRNIDSETVQMIIILLLVFSCLRVMMDERRRLEEGVISAGMVLVIISNTLQIWEQLNQEQKQQLKKFLGLAEISGGNVSLEARVLICNFEKIAGCSRNDVSRVVSFDWFESRTLSSLICCVLITSLTSLLHTLMTSSHDMDHRENIHWFLLENGSSQTLQTLKTCDSLFHA